MSEVFDPALVDLQAAMPQHWAADDQASELYKVLLVIAEQQDDLADAIEAIHADQSMSTATLDGLRAEWARIYGAENEQLAFADAESLRGYLQARASEDGSVTSLESTLLGLLRNADNDTSTPLTFGAGALTYDADGLGPLLTGEFIVERGLVFAADGSGLQLPADGSPLAGPAKTRLTIVERYSDPRIEVKVREVLAYDAAAFARAAERFRMAHNLPVLITPIP